MTAHRTESTSVQVSEKEILLPTYPLRPPDKNPMFLEKRVYQGSSGKVYPNPFTDRLSCHEVDKPYRALFLENEFIRLMILPEIGGRIHTGQDKTNGYDFFYRQNVIKPALVGLLGPWISGGVEFNWPQHHRPSTFMPVQYMVQEEDDGSRTVWLSEHEPMNRMKGMVGICLHPGKAFIEAKVRLYNRTPLVQTFLWWANVGVRVNDQYQAFFPPDVAFVADHAKRALSSFPVARNFYYGVDYTTSVDISWYKNIPVPTSYMVANSEYDFFGGYDHGKEAGFVHVADRHIAPGKKLWTWGNSEFGHAWNRNLTDSDGPYIELMAGVYTDNQPDFSFIQPFETKGFSQFWYPIQKIGPAKNANRLAAVNLETNGARTKIGVCVTEPLDKVRIELSADQEAVFTSVSDVDPGDPFIGSVATNKLGTRDLLLRVFNAAGLEIIRYRPEPRIESSPPVIGSEPPTPDEIENSERLFVTGLHLEQYRHATRSPEPYWREALRRDPLDARCNNALGLRLLRRGQFVEAEAHFRLALQRLTERNPNPYDGEAFYNLGLALRWQRRWDDAYEPFFKATWNYAWYTASYYALATIDCARGNFESALEHLDRALTTNVESLRVRGLKMGVLRRLGRLEEARRIATETLAFDTLDFHARCELWFLALADSVSAAQQSMFSLLQCDTQTVLDLAFEYAEAGMWEEAVRVLEAYVAVGGKAYPMVFYALGYWKAFLGDMAASDSYVAKANCTKPDYCFPARLEEMVILEWACQSSRSDGKAPYYLGNLLYDKWRYEDAITHWEHSVALDPSFSIPWRNLGLAYFNVRRDVDKARDAYQKAFNAANPADSRLLYELDQLDKRVGADPKDRLARLQENRTLVDQRDDLTIELVTLFNQTGESGKALGILTSRRFDPWEGGEGLVSGQYVCAHLLVGRSLLQAGRPAEALEHFEAARNYPPNLGEGKHPLTSEIHLDYFSGVAAKQIGLADEASAFFHKAETAAGNSWIGYFKAKCLFEICHSAAARAILQDMKVAAEAQMRIPANVDYFATSLPNFLLFEDDLEKRNRVECLFTIALAEAGMGNTEVAKEKLREVLELDRNHLPAQEELRWLHAGVSQ